MTHTDERHLLTHAADMGGWLSRSYITEQYREPMNRLVAAGLFRYEENGGPERFVLTEFGRGMADSMKGE